MLVQFVINQLLCLYKFQIHTRINVDFGEAGFSGAQLLLFAILIIIAHFAGVVWVMKRFPRLSRVRSRKLRDIDAKFRHLTFIWNRVGEQESDVRFCTGSC